MSDDFVIRLIFFPNLFKNHEFMKSINNGVDVIQKSEPVQFSIVVWFRGWDLGLTSKMNPFKLFNLMLINFLVLWTISYIQTVFTLNIDLFLKIDRLN